MLLGPLWLSDAYVITIGLDYCTVKGRTRGFPRFHSWVWGCAMPGSTSSRIRRRTQGQSRSRLKRLYLHSFYSLTSLLIKCFAPLEVIISPPRSPGSPYQRITNLGLCSSQRRSKNHSHQMSRRCRLRIRQ